MKNIDNKNSGDNENLNNNREGANNADAMKKNELPKVLQNEVQVNNLFFYQKSEVLYVMTFHFVNRFLPSKGDRTVDQMLQAARSGKQNIIEGMAEGVASAELQLKLLNVARSSFKELRADYEDYLQTRHLFIWNKQHPRYNEMLHFCRYHNLVADYEPYFHKWNDEELCNIALSLLHIIDKMMKTYLEGLDKQFVTQGGIKERMYAARTGYRKGQEEELLRLTGNNRDLQEMNRQLQDNNKSLQEENRLLHEKNKQLRQEVPILRQQIEQLLSEKRHLEVLLAQARSYKEHR